MKFCIIDVNNLVHRCKHVIKDYSDPDECAALVITIVFGSLKKTFQKFDSKHCVACFDSASWRKEFYPLYKANRIEDEATMTDEKKEEKQIIKDVLKAIRDYLDNYTNVTVLEGYAIEADDFIARWVQLHDDKNYQHIIVSPDSDFKQLVSENVKLFNPLVNILYTVEGVFHQDGKRITSKDEVVKLYGENWKVKKNKISKKEWELFFKIARGDTSDNIPSIKPGEYEKKLRLVYEDGGGELWNNFINQIYYNKKIEKNIKVRELYDRNKKLIDLKDQPEHIKEKMDKLIEMALLKERKPLKKIFEENTLHYLKKKAQQRASEFDPEKKRVFLEKFYARQRRTKRRLSVLLVIVILISCSMFYWVVITIY